MKILITGGCGFVGSNLAIYFKIKYPDYQVTVFDNLIRKGSELNVPRLLAIDIKFIKGDVRNVKEVQSLAKMDVIIDAAAEPSVLSGIKDDPRYIIDTNLGGTLNLLQLAQKHGALFLFLSTSRVFPFKTLNALPHIELDTRFEFLYQNFKGFSEFGINEAFPSDGPKSFYGASKYTSEVFIEEYVAFHQLSAIINRFGIIAGPYQMGKVDQGVVVFWAAAHFWRKPISYIGFGGMGKQVRDVLHIDDACTLLDMQLHQPDNFQGQTFNVGGGKENSISLLELTSLCQDLTGHSIEIGKIPETRPADMRIYYTDNSKIKKICGWGPEKSISVCLSDIYQWLKSDEATLKEIFA